jgi:hypothetical protein
MNSTPPRLPLQRGGITKGLAVHAEALHDDRVWRRLRAILTLMTRRGSRATFFVYPFRAVVAGKDISDRVRRLAALGHEIGQHTHFYAGTAIASPEKRNDLSDDNVRACIKRDFEWLRRVTGAPNGFTAGAWLAPDSLYAVLIELGFAYDCSARVPALCRGARPASTLWLEQTQVRKSPAGSVKILPTTHTLGDGLLRRRRETCLLSSGEGYQLAYLHDYDLLRWPVFAGLVWQLVFGAPFLPARALVDAPPL